MVNLRARPAHVPLLGLAVIVVAIASLLFYRHYRTAAFPEHAVQLSITREQAEDRSAAFLRDVFEQDVSEYRSATIWRIDATPKTYLEKELGVERTTELADAVDLWDFWTRYFRPGQKEEHRVAVAPDGSVVGYRHMVDEAAAGARLTRDEAFRLAEEARRTIVQQPGDWQLVDASSTEQPARRDWSFSWKRTDLHIPSTGPDGRDQSQVRLDMIVQGDQVGAFWLYLRVPEAWSREYEQTRWANELAQMLDQLLGFVPLFLLALVVLVRRFVRHDPDWRMPALLAVVGGVLAAAETLNGLPYILSQYDTQVAWEGFLGQIGLGAAFQALYYLLQILIFGAAGEALYRIAFPDHLSLRASFSWRGAMTRRGAVALGLGSLLAFVMAAYQIVYYLIGTSLGIWSPADSKYDSVFNAVAPWLTSATVGYTASVSEEFAFRLFAIPILTAMFARALGRERLALWLAIVLSAAVWAFLHSSYPQDPFFARGVEITIVGIAFGWLMVRFGILAPLALHYTFDALVTASVTDHAGSTSISVLAYGVTVIPLTVALIAVVRARLRGGFLPADRLLNGAASTTAAPETAPPPVTVAAWRYPSLTARQRRGVLALGALGLAALLYVGLMVPARHVQRVSAAEAANQGDAALIEAGLDPASFERVVSLQTTDVALQRAYLREHGGPDAERAVFDDIVPTRTWLVRYFRPLERDEYWVVVHPAAEQGTSPFSFWHVLAETTPGARLAVDEAQRRAEAYLQAIPAWQHAELTLVDQSVQEQVQRTDYTFTFERTDVRYGDATLRASLSVVGDNVSAYRPFVRVPEEWTRARSSTSTESVAAIGLAAGLTIFLLVLAALAFLRLARQRALSLWAAGLAAGLVALIGLADLVNNWPVLFATYPTTSPVPTFLAQSVATSAVGLVLVALLGGVGWSLLHALWRSEVAAVVPDEHRTDWAGDTASLGLALPALLCGLSLAVESADVAQPLLGLTEAAPIGAATSVPAVAALASSVAWMLVVMALTIAALLVRRLFGRAWPVLATGLLLASLQAFMVTAPEEQVALAAQGISLVLLLAAGSRWLLRANLAAYLTVAAVFGLLFDALPLLQTADAWLIANGAALAILAVALPLGWLLLDRRAASPAGGGDTAIAHSRPTRRAQNLPTPPLAAR